MNIDFTWEGGRSLDVVYIIILPWYTVVYGLKIPWYTRVYYGTNTIVYHGPWYLYHTTNV